MPGYIHHIQWCVTDIEVAKKSLMEGYQFQLIASREGQNREAVLTSGEITFLLSERTASQQPDLGACYPWLRCKCRDEPSHQIDSVFNVCLEVADVDKTFINMTSNGSEILHPPVTISTPQGSIHYAVVTSPCNNVIHSLVNTHNFHGVFLPGFAACETVNDKTEDAMLTHIDHVTYVVNEGESENILGWYRDCCGMEKFQITSDDDPEVGTVFTDVGMKLNAGDWISEWMCREDGVMWTDELEQPMRNFKLVIAEPLADREDSHVHNFLRDHGGPGLQHIAFSTDNITRTMKKLTKNGAFFRKPPPTYYTLEGKIEEIQAIGEDPKIFQELGILIDPEYTKEKNEKDRVTDYLLQIFSFPLFDTNTFFLEIIQRQGSRGFGGGNIRALAASIIELEKQHQEQIMETKKMLTRAPSRKILKTISHNDMGTPYNFKPKLLHKSMTKHTFNLEDTISLEELKMETERMAKNMKSIIHCI